MLEIANPPFWLIFPHQLFDQLPEGVETVAVLEDQLFFQQFAFHKQKLQFHRATMRCYADGLRQRGLDVRYLGIENGSPEMDECLRTCAQEGVDLIGLYRPEDFYLSKRLSVAAEKYGITLIHHDTPQFLLNQVNVNSYFEGKKHFLQGNFYSAQRKQFEVLMDGTKPKGGKWSFDEDNRERFPKGGLVPQLNKGRAEDEDTYWNEAVDYVQRYFPDAPGAVEGDFNYAISHEGAQRWLKDFIDSRMLGFGTYEDALVAKEPLLHHSLLSVYLNSGLLLPADVLDAVLHAHRERDLPLNDVEGFVRQLLGWREFIRGIYVSVGRQQRTRNYWGYTRKIPKSFYDGTTGIVPVDVVIKKVLKNGYCHHIERLMVLSNFMLLCDFDPDEVYRWFMELFMDAYDWVMVPNVYGMGQFADGGMMSTKPYISGSNYLIKMGDFEKGAWTEVWDALYWRFIDKHRDFFLKNPRMGVMVKSYDKMDTEKRERLSMAATKYLDRLNDE